MATTSAQAVPRSSELVLLGPPSVLVEALAFLDAPPPAYLVGDGHVREALARLVRHSVRIRDRAGRRPMGP